jgi:CubicO group peptidase (beta-lactamase class C family)
MILRRISVVIVALLFGQAAIGQAKSIPTSSKIDIYMRALARNRGFQGAVVVAKNGHPIRMAGYGAANVEWNVANSPDTRFRIGSVTKQFTAAAILALQERGKLRVSDNACRYLSDCPAAWQAITIDQLLAHTSGIPDYVSFNDFESTESLPTTPQALVARFRDKPLQFTPGAKFSYSNSGYVLLGMIIERVAGEPYAEYMKKNIFDVLHMASSGYDSNAEIIPKRAAGYSMGRAHLQNALCVDPSVAYAAGALYSTVRDLLLWDEALYSDSLLPRSSIEQMFAPHLDGVAYGWVIGTLFGRKMEHHNGSISGFVSNVARFPEQHIYIAVLSNREDTPVDGITKDLAAIVFGEQYKLPQRRTIAKLNPGVYRRYVGVYRISANLQVKITGNGQNLMATLSGDEGEPFVLTPESTTKFFSDSPPAEMEFTLDSQGNAVSVLINGEYRGARVDVNPE